MTTRNNNSHIRQLLFRMPFMITCLQFEAFIYAYLEGELPRTQKVIFEIHIKFCRECREYLTALRRSIELGQSVMSDDSNLPPVPEDLVEAVMLALKDGD